MSDESELSVPAFLASGRRLLQQAAEIYARPLSPAEFWWLGVGLAAATLAELGGKTFAAGRVEQLMERLGRSGFREEWLQQCVDELAGLDAEGVLWPLYQRDETGAMVPTGIEVQPGFDAEAAYFVALAHIGVAVALHREARETVSDLADAVRTLVEEGSRPDLERFILGAFEAPPHGAVPPET